MVGRKGKRKIDTTKARETRAARNVTFTKRRQGVFKKEDKLHSLTGAEVATLVFSPAGRPYTHGCPSFRHTIQKYLAGVQENGDREAEWWRSWLDGIQVERYEDEAALLFLKGGLEELQQRLAETELIHDLLADEDYFPDQSCL